MPDVFPNLRWKVPYRSSMQKTTLSFLPIAFLVQIIGATCLARAQAEKARYPAMAPLDLYLAPDQNSEIALARSAAPASISDAAEVMVLGRAGYRTAVKGSNGFLCIVIYRQTRVQNCSCARVATAVKPTKPPPTQSTGESLAFRRPECPQRAGVARQRFRYTDNVFSCGTPDVNEYCPDHPDYGHRM